MSGCPHLSARRGPGTDPPLPPLLPPRSSNHAADHHCCCQALLAAAPLGTPAVAEAVRPAAAASSAACPVHCASTLKCSSRKHLSPCRGQGEEHPTAKAIRLLNQQHQQITTNRCTLHSVYVHDRRSWKRATIEHRSSACCPHVCVPRRSVPCPAGRARQVRLRVCATGCCRPVVVASPHLRRHLDLHGIRVQLNFRVLFLAELCEDAWMLGTPF